MVQNGKNVKLWTRAVRKNREGFLWKALFFMAGLRTLGKAAFF